MLKKFLEGVIDKSHDKFNPEKLKKVNKKNIESDCAICFSSSTSHNNPIVYCSGKQ